VDPTRQPLRFPNLSPSHPAVDAPTSRVSRPPPHAPNLLLSPHPTHSPLSPSCTLCRHLASLPRTARNRGAPSPFTVTSGPFCGLRRASVVLIALVSSASSSATQDTPWFGPTPSVSLCSRSSDSRRAAVSPPPSTRVPAVFSPSLKRSRAIYQGNPPPHTPNFPFPSLLLAQLLAEVG
jgi:hypothetical protein